MIIEACTFTSLARGRYRCNHCRLPTGGHVVVSGRQVEPHRANMYSRLNPRRKPPPLIGASTKKSWASAEVY